MTSYMNKMFRKHSYYLPTLFAETITYLDDVTFTAKDSDYTLYTFSLHQDGSIRLSEELQGMTCCLISQTGGNIGKKYWLYLHDHKGAGDMRFAYTFFYDTFKCTFEKGIIYGDGFPLDTVVQIRRQFWAVLKELPENRLLYATGLLKE